MPILFPVNRIGGAQFVFEGRTYKFPVNEPKTGCHLHGCLHEIPFIAEEITSNSISCVYKATKERPYLDFPHSFQLVIRYVLTDKGLCQKVMIKNLSERNMPLLLGFHTTFQLPFLAGSRAGGQLIQADVAEEYERDDHTRLPTGRILEPDKISEELRSGQFTSYRQKVSRHYRCGRTGGLSITDVDTEISVVYENSAEYAYRLIYNGEGDEYICLEPQTCLVDCVNHPFPDETGLISLRPDEEKCFRSFIGLAVPYSTFFKGNEEKRSLVGGIKEKI